jgi:hypothetical protein
MKTRITKIFIAFFITGCLLNNSSIAQTQKLAQTGMKFLNVSTDARNAGMAGAITSLYSGSSAMFYNPASMAEIDKIADVTLSQTNWIADINYIAASVAVQPFDTYMGVFGVSVVAVDYGEFQQTIRSDNEKGFIDIGTYSPSAIAIGVGYARSLSEKFSIGGNIKYVRQSLIGDGVVGLLDAGAYETEKFEESVFAFDFGLIYQTGYKSLNLGMSVRNFSEEIKYIEDGFQLPIIFQLGMSMNLFDLLEYDPNEHSFLFSVDASHPRDYEEQIFIGGEYTFINTFSIRSGYNFPRDDGGFSAGIGLKHELQGILVSVDYAYSEWSIFKDVHRFSIRFGY